MLILAGCSSNPSGASTATISSRAWPARCWVEHNATMSSAYLINTPSRWPWSRHATSSVCSAILASNQQRGNWRALRGSGTAIGGDPACQHSHPKPGPEQLEHRPVRHPPTHLGQNGVPVQAVEAISDVGVEHPLPAPVSRRPDPVSYTHLRAHETVLDLVCR